MLCSRLKRTASKATHTASLILVTLTDTMTNIKVVHQPLVHQALTLEETDLMQHLVERRQSLLGKGDERKVESWVIAMWIAIEKL